MNSEGVRKACSHFFVSESVVRMTMNGVEDFFRCVMEESAIQDLDNWE